MATSVPPVRPPSPFAHLSRSNAGAGKGGPADENDDTDADEDDEDDDTDDTDENGKKTKKSKKVKKAEDDNDDDDDKDAKARAVRMREKARIRTIVHSAAGKRLPAAALHLALGSSMPRHAAVKLLASMPSDASEGKGETLRDRMSGVHAEVGAGGDQSSGVPTNARELAAAIVAAGKKARGEK